MVAAWIGRAAYRREMVKAIHDAARETALFKGSSLSDGLRCIRTFERVNGRAFDPFDSYHRSITYGMGAHEALNRRLARIKAAHEGLTRQPRQPVPKPL